MYSVMAIDFLPKWATTEHNNWCNTTELGATEADRPLAAERVVGDGSFLTAWQQPSYGKLVPAQRLDGAQLRRSFFTFSFAFFSASCNLSVRVAASRAAGHADVERVSHLVRELTCKVTHGRTSPAYTRQTELPY